MPGDQSSTLSACSAKYVGIGGNAQLLGHAGGQQAVFLISQRPDIGPRRHQLSGPDNPVEVLHRDRSWRACRQGKVLLGHRIDVEPPFLGFLRLSLNCVHDSGASPTISVCSREHGLRNRLGYLRQNRLQAADHGFKQADAVPERSVHVRFDRALVVQVDNPHDPMLLAEAINPADTLFYPSWGSTACRN